MGKENYFEEKLEKIGVALDLLKQHANIKLKKQKQWDFFLCKEVWVHKIVFENTIIHVSEEDFEKLKILGFECITID